MAAAAAAAGGCCLPLGSRLLCRCMFGRRRLERAKAAPVWARPAWEMQKRCRRSRRRWRRFGCASKRRGWSTPPRPRQYTASCSHGRRAVPGARRSCRARSRRLASACTARRSSQRRASSLPPRPHSALTYALARRPLPVPRAAAHRHRLRACPGRRQRLGFGNNGLWPMPNPKMPMPGAPPWPAVLTSVDRASALR